MNCFSPSFELVINQLIHHYRNVFKQLIYCAEHPATTKQLAAATAFNAFYRTFRLLLL